MNIFLLPFTKVKSQINQWRKDSLKKCYEKLWCQNFAISAQKWLKIAAQIKSYFWVMGLCPDQQQHPAVHTGVVSRGGCMAVADGVIYMYFHLKIWLSFNFTIFFLKFCHNLFCWVVKIWVFEFCHNLSFWVMSQFVCFFFTIFFSFFSPSPFEFSS